MKPLTVKQLITLLAINQGTNVAFLANDPNIKALSGIEFIQHGGGSWHITSKASEYIKRILSIEPPKPVKDIGMVLHELNALGFRLTICESLFGTNQTEIAIIDNKTGESVAQQLPTDHHLHTKLIGCIDFAKTALIEQLKQKK